MKKLNVLILGCLFLLLGSCKESKNNERNSQDQSQARLDNEEKEAEKILAIDVLLNPGDRMLDKAKNYNDRLRANYPEGFELDASHTPHISIIQAYVKEGDLEKIETELEELVSSARLEELKLEASGLYYIPFEDKGLAGITIKKDELMDFHMKVLKIMESYTLNQGNGSAFVARPDGEPIMAETVEYVNKFRQNSSGENFNPHVTIGVAYEEFINEMQQEDFENFQFEVKSVSIYQLGEMGTAQKELASIQLNGTASN